MSFLEILIDVLTKHSTPPPTPPPPVDRAALREQMTYEDADYARVRQAHHDAMQALTVKGVRDGLAIRREREFWERYGKPNGGQAP